MTCQPSEDEAFESHRKHLMGLAYRMTGSVADAEDVVQEAYLRWNRSERHTVAHPRAFLSRTVTRLCLDALKSARARRETYVGPWLPEPVLGEHAIAADDATALAHDISMALMLALERLSPTERAAFVLHDVFDASYSEVADVLDRSEASCRQLVSRARSHLRSSRPKYRPSREEHQRIVRAFGAAVLTGEIDALRRMLADDAVLYSDGGGKVVSALRPIHGRDPIARFLLGVVKKFPLSDSARLTERIVNGALGFFIEEQGQPVQTIGLEVRGHRISAVYVVRNPDKLTRLAQPRPSISLR